MSCVEHTQAGDKQVYGYKWQDGKVYLMHRLVYCQHNGCTLEDIQGKVVRHTCDNRRCINPTHLLIGSHSDNMKDMWERGRGTNLPPRLTNEQHPQCKVSDEVVAALREAHQLGVSRKELQAMSGLSKSQVQRIVTYTGRT